MKAILTSILLIIGVFAIACQVFAEPTHPNEVGLYMAPNGHGATGTSEMGVIVDVHLVLTKPTDMETGLPLDSIKTFECQLDFSSIPSDGLYKLSPDIFPGDAINVGDSSNLNDGILEYYVGFQDPIPVIDEAVVLVTIQFLLLTTTVIEVSLASPSLSSIPGQMVFGPDFSSQQIMHPVSGSNEDPVFRFNGQAVGVENETFGSVKALFR